MEITVSKFLFKEPSNIRITFGKNSDFLNSKNSLLLYTQLEQLKFVKRVLRSSPNCKAGVVRWTKAVCIKLALFRNFTYTLLKFN